MARSSAIVEEQRSHDHVILSHLNCNLTQKLTLFESGFEKKSVLSDDKRHFEVPPC